MPICSACGSNISLGASDCPKCGTLTSCPSEDADAKSIAKFTTVLKTVLGSLAWAVVAIPLAFVALDSAYYSFAAYYLGYSLRSPSPYRLDFVGTPALIAGMSALLWVVAFLILAFPRARKYWLASVLLLVGGFLIQNYVALPLHQKT